MNERKTFEDGTEGITLSKPGREARDGLAGESHSGQGRARKLADGSIELALQMAPGTFPAYVSFSTDDAGELGRWLIEATARNAHAFEQGDGGLCRFQGCGLPRGGKAHSA